MTKYRQVTISWAEAEGDEGFDYTDQQVVNAFMGACWWLGSRAIVECQTDIDVAPSAD